MTAGYYSTQPPRHLRQTGTPPWSDLPYEETPVPIYQEQLAPDQAGRLVRFLGAVFVLTLLSGIAIGWWLHG